MLAGMGKYVSLPAGIANMIAQQLGPSQGVSPDIVGSECPEMSGVSESEITTSLGMYLKDTSPGNERMTYPCIWWFRGRWPVRFDEKVRRFLSQDHRDYHIEEVVLIQRADVTNQPPL